MKNTETNLLNNPDKELTDSQFPLFKLNIDFNNNIFLTNPKIFIKTWFFGLLLPYLQKIKNYGKI